MQKQLRWFRDEGSFGVHNDEGEVIARNLYRDIETQDGTLQRVFPGIHVRPDHRGVGLASELTKHSLDVSLEEGFRIVPICPYVAQWMREYDNGAYLPYRDEPGAEHFHVD
jgi:hypothetical protein